MSERVYHNNRKEVFRQCGLNPNDTDYDTHHIKTRQDKKKKLLPKNFKLHARENLVPLEVELHFELHEIIKREEYRNDISNRVYLANLAFIDDLERLD
jgi:hypothetical protein